MWGRNPKQDIELIRSRSKLAKKLYKNGNAKKMAIVANQNKQSLEYEVSSSNIFANLGRDNADELLARAKLLDNVSTLIKNCRLSQQEVADKLGITQSTVSMLAGGRLSAFSIGTLLHYLSILGCEVQIHVKKPRTRTGIFQCKGSIVIC